MKKLGFIVVVAFLCGMLGMTWSSQAMAQEDQCGVADCCSNGIDDDSDSSIDCDDLDCSRDLACIGPPESDCGDGADNDSDGYIDCADPGCTLNQDPACCEFPTLETYGPRCINGIDDDCDGLVDCWEPDCAGYLVLTTCSVNPIGCVGVGMRTMCFESAYLDEPCSNGYDDNGDGKQDSADFSCFSTEVPESTCADGRDNDFDSLFDCDDPDCFLADPIYNPDPESICGVVVDTDGDGIEDSVDNCPGNYNPDQEISVPGATVGDACNSLVVDSGMEKLVQSGDLVSNNPHRQVKVKKNPGDAYIATNGGIAGPSLPDLRVDPVEHDEYVKISLNDVTSNGVSLGTKVAAIDFAPFNWNHYSGLIMSGSSDIKYHIGSGANSIALGVELRDISAVPAGQDVEVSWLIEVSSGLSFEDMGGKISIIRKIGGYNVFIVSSAGYATNGTSWEASDDDDNIIHPLRAIGEASGWTTTSSITGEMTGVLYPVEHGRTNLEAIGYTTGWSGQNGDQADAGKLALQVFPTANPQVKEVKIVIPQLVVDANRNFSTMLATGIRVSVLLKHDSLESATMFPAGAAVTFKHINLYDENMSETIIDPIWTVANPQPHPSPAGQTYDAGMFSHPGTVSFPEQVDAVNLDATLAFAGSSVDFDGLAKINFPDGGGGVRFMMAGEVHPDDPLVSSEPDRAIAGKLLAARLNFDKLEITGPKSCLSAIETIVEGDEFTCRIGGNPNAEGNPSLRLAKGTGLVIGAVTGKAATFFDPKAKIWRGSLLANPADRFALGDGSVHPLSAKTGRAAALGKYRIKRVDIEGHGDPLRPEPNGMFVFGPMKPSSLGSYVWVDGQGKFESTREVLKASRISKVGTGLSVIGTGARNDFGVPQTVNDVLTRQYFDNVVIEDVDFGFSAGRAEVTLDRTLVHNTMFNAITFGTNTNIDSIPDATDRVSIYGSPNVAYGGDSYATVKGGSAYTKILVKNSIIGYDYVNKVVDSGLSPNIDQLVSEDPETLRGTGDGNKLLFGSPTWELTRSVGIIVGSGQTVDPSRISFDAIDSTIGKRSAWLAVDNIDNLHGEFDYLAERNCYIKEGGSCGVDEQMIATARDTPVDSKLRLDESATRALARVKPTRNSGPDTDGDGCPDFLELPEGGCGALASCSDIVGSIQQIGNNYAKSSGIANVIIRLTDKGVARCEQDAQNGIPMFKATQNVIRNQLGEYLDNNFVVDGELIKFVDGLLEQAKTACCGI